MLRNPVAAALVLVCVAASAVVQLMLFTGRDVTESDRFAQVVVRTSATPTGSDLVAGRVVEVLTENQRIPAVATRAMHAGIREMVGSRRFAEEVAPLVESSHRELITNPESGIPIPTAPLAPMIHDTVSRIPGGPGVSVVPSADEMPTVVIPVASEVRPAVSFLRWLNSWWWFAAVIALAAGGGAVAFGGVSILRSLGIGIAALAVLPPLIRWVIPQIAQIATPEPYGDIAVVFSQDLTRLWMPAALITLGIGVALSVAGWLLERRR